MPASGVNTIEQITNAGVSVWLDDLSRQRIESGNLNDLIAKYSVRGVTTNPSIFEGAIKSGSEAYEPQILECAIQGLSAAETVRRITTDDVRNACDLFLGLYRASSGVDGRVSIEVDPRFAHDTQSTIADALSLWETVNRPNLMIKIPATTEGLPAISEVISHGISVNVTLIFSVSRYQQVIDAYMTGLEMAAMRGIDLQSIHSVASFFISRVDTSVDQKLDKLNSAEAQRLRGRAAIANACVAWQAHVDSIATPRWIALSGANVQRPLWASTGVKDPSYSDTRYVIDLVAPGCVNTMPEKTLQAVKDHGVFAGDTVSGQFPQSLEILNELSSLGIDFDHILENLEADGVEKFIAAWNGLLETVDEALRESQSLS